MSSNRNVELSAAIVLSADFTVSAATEHHSVTHAHPVIYNVAPGYNSDNHCSPAGGPTCSDRCLPSGPPCKTEPDGW
jgi:hypothetical protein